MFRSATNVLGNALATSVVGQWEENNEIDIVSLD
jgi:Na+/H+-dicarboxylate symporter